MPLARAVGPDVLPPSFPTVIHMLRDAAEKSPGAEALVFEDRRLTYRQYLNCVAGFAAELAALGVCGNRVALVLGNSAEIAIATYAAQAAGAQVVPLNPIYTERELTDILQDADPLLVLHDAGNALVAPLVEKLGIRHRMALGPGGRLLTGWATGPALDLPQPLPAPGDLATLQYTGGTTGRSKGVDIKHGPMMINVAQREGPLPTRPDRERLLCVMPLFHVYAVSMLLYLTSYCRGCLVILPRYRPDWVLKAMSDEKITIFPGSPTMFTGLMSYDGFAATDFSHLHLCYSGASALPDEVMRRWEAAVGCRVYEGFGQTESGPVVAYNPVGGVGKPASTGLPLPLTEIEIVDPEKGGPEDGGRIMEVGEQGEIRVRGPQLMAGYRNLPEATAESLRHGWLHTGDIGELDADGYLFIRDRKKDMAIVGGYNVYPREIDEVLYLHPDVLEAAAVGVPDDYRGEVIRAFVVLRAGGAAQSADLMAHCVTNLAKYKVPVAIDLVDAIPKTTVGKVDKKQLRERVRGAA